MMLLKKYFIGLVVLVIIYHLAYTDGSVYNRSCIDVLKGGVTIIQALTAVLGVVISVFVYWNQKNMEKRTADLALHKERYQLYVRMLDQIDEMILNTPYQYPVGKVDPREHLKYSQHMGVKRFQLVRDQEQIAFIFSCDFTEKIMPYIDELLYLLDSIKTLHMEHATKMELDDRSGYDEWYKKIREAEKDVSACKDKVRNTFKEYMKYPFDK